MFPFNHIQSKRVPKTKAFVLSLPFTTSHSLSLLFLFLSLFSITQAQNITYATDTACGCDIQYVDGIETTRNGDLYGFRRYDGTVIVPNIYRYVGQFSHGYCKVWIVDTLAVTPQGQEPPLVCGLIDTTGREVVPCRYDDVDYPSDNRILVTKNNLFGFSDLGGNLITPIHFPMASSFQERRAVIAQYIDSFFVFYTFIDTTGRQLFPPVFQNAAPFTEGFAPVYRYDRWGLIDTLGNEVLTCRFDNLTFPDHGTCFAGDSMGLALYRLPSPNHPQATRLTQPLYQPITGVTQNRIAVSRDGFQGFLDLNGNEIIPCIYDEVGLFRYGRTLARLDNHYGIIDTLGKTILPIEYENKTPKGNKYVYYDSVALIEKEGRLSFVDLDGKLILPMRLEQAYHFSQGLAAVRFEGHWGYINNHGDIYMPFIFDIASPFQWNRADVFFGGHHMVIDHDGRCVKNCNGIISFR